MPSQARAIIWAQWRTLFHHLTRSKGNRNWFPIVVSVFWYGLWVLAAAGAAALTSDPRDHETAAVLLPYALLLAVFYWQAIPILMAATGVSLEMKKLVVYPIPHAQLFGLEVLLRLSTGLEVLLLLAGTSIGLWLNPTASRWGPVAFLPFVLMNLFLAAGIRDLVKRILAHQRIREAAMLVLVLVIALPQVVLISGARDRVSVFFQGKPSPFWPWTAAAQLVMGEGSVLAALVLSAWLAAAYAFGRWQFQKSLSFDASAGNATRVVPAKASNSFMEKLYRLPNVIFPDPLSAVIEKEVRYLTRAPRFRIVFTMGFTFGLLIWLPMAFGSRGGGTSTLATNYLTVISVYALMLLGEVSFWNSFGFDRSAVQFYFLTPVPLSTVLLGKNITAAFFVLLEITAVAIACATLGMPLSPRKVAEAYSVTLVMTLYLLGMGNLSSTHYPRPANPYQSMRSGTGGRMQALLLVFYPAAGLPVLLAYGARYAFDSELGFYGGLLFGAVLGAAVYWVAMDSAINTATVNREKMIATLSGGDSPIGGS